MHLGARGLADDEQAGGGGHGEYRARPKRQFCAADGAGAGFGDKGFQRPGHKNCFNP